MKYLRIFLLILLNVTFQLAVAQKFEGTITWKISTSLNSGDKSNAITTAEMDEALKKLEEQMNNPEFKKQMEQNPQMKQMLEENLNKMKAAQAQAGAEGLKLMPTRLVIKVKNGNSLVNMDGAIGAMMGEILYLKDKNKSYKLDRNAKKYSVLPDNKPSDTRSDMKVTKTGRTAKIAGYNADEYTVETTEKGRKVKQIIWASTEIKEISPEDFRSGGGNDQIKLYYEKIDGVPVKMISETSQGKMEMEITEIRKESLDNSVFTIPADFKESK